MKYLQAHNKGHNEEGYGNSPNKLRRLRPSLFMIDYNNENKECQRHHIEQREQYFVVYFGEEEHYILFCSPIFVEPLPLRSPKIRSLYSVGDKEI